ncbi:MAG: hypothetical protein KDC98_23250 [Planctomycetes bacterium]|nr:hypothetical protein [Planctomycetota bacterium]
MKLMNSMRKERRFVGTDDRAGDLSQRRRKYVRKVTEGMVLPILPDVRLARDL